METHRFPDNHNKLVYLTRSQPSSNLKRSTWRTIGWRRREGGTRTAGSRCTRWWPLGWRKHGGFDRWWWKLWLRRCWRKWRLWRRRRRSWRGTERQRQRGREERWLIFLLFHCLPARWPFFFFIANQLTHINNFNSHNFLMSQSNDHWSSPINQEEQERRRQVQKERTRMMEKKKKEEEARRAQQVTFLSLSCLHSDHQQGTKRQRQRH